MSRQIGSTIFPDDVTEEEIAQILFRAPVASPPAVPSQGASPQETEFERTSPDVAASRAASRRLSRAETGETVSRAVRDAAAMTLATLLTRGAGGGALPQALARIGTAGGLKAAETPGTLSERAGAGALGAGGAAVPEALFAAPAGALMGARGIGRLLSSLKPAASAPVKLGAGLGIGLNAKDLTPTPLLYNAAGRPILSRVPGVEALEAAVPRLRALGVPPAASKGMPGVGGTAARIGADVLGTRDPELTIGGALGLGALMLPQAHPGRYRGGMPTP